MNHGRSEANITFIHELVKLLPHSYSHFKFWMAIQKSKRFFGPTLLYIWKGGGWKELNSLLNENAGFIQMENSRVPLLYLPKKFFKPLDVQDYILAIHFKFEIKIPLNQLREEPVVAFFLPSFSTILGLNKINIR